MTDDLDSLKPTRKAAPSNSVAIGAGIGGPLAVVGAAVAMIVCCAGPALIAAGALTVLVIVVSCFCIYSAATLGKLWKSRPADPSPKKTSKSRK